MVKTDMQEILKRAEVFAQRRTAQIKFAEMTQGLQKEMRVAYRTQDRETANKLRDKMNKIRKKVYGPQEDGRMQQMRQRYREQTRETDPRWAGFSRDMVRASEVSSPARPGHFLRQFGQSDRETIENANADATVPQILTLLNGPMFNQLLNRNSTLQKNLSAAESNEEKLEVIFVSILNRRPTEEEKAITLSQLEDDARRGISNVVWALLNTRQFMFVQ